MNIKSILLLIAIALGICLAIGGYSAYRGTPIQNLWTHVEVGSVYKATRIQVIEGNTFDITLGTGARVKAELTVNTPPEAVSKVIGILNRSTDPRVHIVKKVDDVWVVRLQITTEEGTIYLSDWLKQNQLVWE